LERHKGRRNRGSGEGGRSEPRKRERMVQKKISMENQAVERGGSKWREKQGNPHRTSKSSRYVAEKGQGPGRKERGGKKVSTWEGTEKNSNTMTLDEEKRKANHRSASGQSCKDKTIGIEKRDSKKKRKKEGREREITRGGRRWKKGFQKREKTIPFRGRVREKRGTEGEPKD